MHFPPPRLRDLSWRNCCEKYGRESSFINIKLTRQRLVMAVTTDLLTRVMMLIFYCNNWVCDVSENVLFERYYHKCYGLWVQIFHRKKKSLIYIKRFIFVLFAFSRLLQWRDDTTKSGSSKMTSKLNNISLKTSLKTFW